MTEYKVVCERENRIEKAWKLDDRFSEIFSESGVSNINMYCTIVDLLEICRVDFRAYIVGTKFGKA